MRMKKSLISIAGATLLTSLASLPVAAQSNEQVFGRELMTQQELQEHRTTMRNLNTDAERAQYRKLHHERMMQRAHERGVELNKGMGQRQGQGMGSGQGKGSGQGMGKGSGGNGKNQEYKIEGSGNQ